MSTQKDPRPAFTEASGYASGAPVLDVCCGPKMMWFDREDSRVVFCDKRNESHTVPDRSHGKTDGVRSFAITPDVVADFTALPFDSGVFDHVVFDPPHLTRAGEGSWMAKKYGKLVGDWRAELRAGFDECFRVLRDGGTLVFKWNETHVPVAEILALTPARPLYGQRCGAKAKTHWVVFLKSHNDKMSGRGEVQNG